MIAIKGTAVKKGSTTTINVNGTSIAYSLILSKRCVASLHPTARERQGTTVSAAPTAFEEAIDEVQSTRLDRELATQREPVQRDGWRPGVHS